mgnify:CR=1 FL=1
MLVGFFTLAQSQLDGDAVGAILRDEGDNRTVLMDAVHEIVGTHKFPKNGQAVIELPEHARACLISGDVERGQVAKAVYTRVREHRGELLVVVDRELMDSRGRLAPMSAGIVVYTKEAFMEDPETTATDKAWAADYAYVVVPFLASRGPKPTLSSSRFVRNLAGGNNAFADKDYTIEKARADAKEVAEYEANWMIVG